MAVITEGRQIGRRVVAAVHQRSSVIDFELIGSAADNTSIPVPTPDVLLDRQGNISVMDDLVARESAEVLVGLAKIYVDPLFANNRGDRRELLRRFGFSPRGSLPFQVVMVLVGLSVVVAFVPVKAARVRKEAGSATTRRIPLTALLQL
jgi:hypothetical protein